MTFRAWTGRLHAFSGEGKANEWAGGVQVEGPVGATLTRFRAALQIGALPDTKLDLENPDTWGKAADLKLSLGRTLGRTLAAGGQRVSLEAVLSWRFWTALEGRSADRYARAYGGGFRLAEHETGAFLEASWGWAQPCGPFRRGQLMLSGIFPLTPKVGGTSLALLGDACLNVASPARGEPGRRDLFEAMVALSR